MRGGTPHEPARYSDGIKYMAFVTAKSCQLSRKQPFDGRNQISVPVRLVENLSE